MYSVRIFSVDHYMATPILGLDPTYSLFRSKEIKQVPVLRIFGSNEAGLKTCLHVHNVFPYLHIPHSELDTGRVQSLCYRVATSIDKAINILSGQADSITQHVYDVLPVVGIPLYGFHNRKHHFLKIRFYNPYNVRRAAQLLLNGAVMDQIFQPHDSHIGYELQFMIDYNLHGMNNIVLSEVKYRKDGENLHEIDPQFILPDNVKRISTCKFEVDCIDNHILNVNEIINGKLTANPGIAAIWEEERQRNRMKNIGSQDVGPKQSQIRYKSGDTSSETFFKERLKERLEYLKKSQESLPSDFSNQSVYPVEANQNTQFLDASIAHLKINSDQTVENLDESIVNESLILSLNETAPSHDTILNGLYDALVSLAEPETENQVDIDSLLSQRVMDKSNEEIENDDDIEQEAADLEQTLIEDGFLLSQEIQEHDQKLEHMTSSDKISHNYSTETLIESEKEYSIFYDDTVNHEVTEKSFTQMLQEDSLQGLIDHEIDEVLDSEESVNEWEKIPQLDGAHDEPPTARKVRQKTVLSSTTSRPSKANAMSSEKSVKKFSKYCEDDPKFLQKCTVLLRRFDDNKGKNAKNEDQIGILSSPLRTKNVNFRQSCQSSPKTVSSPFQNYKYMLLSQSSPKTKTPGYAPIGIICSPVKRLRNSTPSSSQDLVKRDFNLVDAENEKSERKSKMNKTNVPTENLKKTTASSHHKKIETTSKRRTPRQSKIMQEPNLTLIEEDKACSYDPVPTKKKQADNFINLSQIPNSKQVKSYPKPDQYIFDNLANDSRIEFLEKKLESNKNSKKVDEETIEHQKFSNRKKIIDQKVSQNYYCNRVIDLEQTSTIIQKTSSLDIFIDTDNIDQNCLETSENIRSDKMYSSKSDHLFKMQAIIRDSSNSSDVLPDIPYDCYIKTLASPEGVDKRCAGKKNDVNYSMNLEEQTEIINLEIDDSCDPINELNNETCIDLSQTLTEYIPSQSDCQAETILEQGHYHLKTSVHSTYLGEAFSQLKQNKSIDGLGGIEFESKAYPLPIDSNLYQTPNVSGADTHRPFSNSQNKNLLSNSSSNAGQKNRSTGALKLSEEENFNSTFGIENAVEFSQNENEFTTITKDQLAETYFWAKKTASHQKLSNTSNQSSNYSVIKTSKRTRAASTNSESNQRIDTSSIDCSQNKTVSQRHRSGSVELRLSNISQLSTAGVFPATSVYKFTSDGSVILAPKYNSPTYMEVLSSLSEYGIPEIRHEEPFYSNPSDMTSRIEIGHRILKVPSKVTKELPEFKSDLGYSTMDEWRKQIYKLNSYEIKDLASNRELLITPNRKPPSYQQVQNWARAKTIVQTKKEIKIPKLKIRLPFSPGGNNSDHSDGEITLSPLTPKLSKPSTNETPKNSNKTKAPITNKTVIPSTTETPKGSNRTKTPNTNKTVKDSTSPVVFSKQRRCDKHRKSLFKSMVETSLDTSGSKENASVRRLVDELEMSDSMNNSCMITGVTLNNTYGFKVPLENLQKVKTLISHNFLTTLIAEVHANSRGDLKPNPEFDSIQAIFYTIYDDDFLPKCQTGIICVNKSPVLLGTCKNVEITYVNSELELFQHLVKMFHKWDPDILAGYEIQMLSWGYILERSFNLKLNLSKQLSRIPESHYNTRLDEEGKMTDIHFTGRVFLDIWRLMRHEVTLTSYTFENVVFHVLHQRLPKHTFKNLTEFYNKKPYITVQYYLNRVRGIWKLLDQLDFLGRTAELAKLFGIQFYEVLSRGSQFRVESMMLRLAKPLNFIPVSPGVKQRASMKAPEFLPLIMEPHSKLYTDPVIVLDFQSLYPSMMIAHNYCFSTCLGRVDKLGQSYPFEFGATQLRVNPKSLQLLTSKDKLNISPCGVAFVDSSIRQGILPRMLKEILDCRLMVKKSLKDNKSDQTLQKVLHSRQLGLKLIANVTFGYTAANYSGRMPAVEVADSVVSKGRETLERAIKLVENNKTWDVKVVYGDTDSLFVLVPGRNREAAFKIGAEIAQAVTEDNPTPVKLKLEKVYQPCILQAKKRYVGYMYESVDQKEPTYDAKGIETVRRDGCPAVAKILEKTIRILFETRDMSLVKQYVSRQFTKLLSGRANIQDLIFAKEFRGRNGYRPGATVPSLELAKRYRSLDPRNEPRRSERVPYIIATGAPGATLVRLARGPEELLADPGLKPHIHYYITKAIIPPLNRCLLLCGADAFYWYNELPRKQTLNYPTTIVARDTKKSTISQHFATASCVSCSESTRTGVCEKCLQSSQKTLVELYEKARNWERAYFVIRKVCESCCGRGSNMDCASLDCPVLYRLVQTHMDYAQIEFVRNMIEKVSNAESLKF